MYGFVFMIRFQKVQDFLEEESRKLLERWSKVLAAIEAYFQ